jgi:hypothetical protein
VKCACWLYHGLVESFEKPLSELRCLVYDDAPINDEG